MTIVYILVAVLLFGVLIILHEAGHFASAKLCGVKVNEFSLGMGPLLWQKQKGETAYSLRALPIGGYCAMEGEDEDSDDPRAFSAQGFWAKFLILVSGAAMNFLTGFVIVALLYANAAAFYSPVVQGFAEGCPLEGRQGLQVGDKLTAIDGEKVYVYSDISLLFSLTPGETHDLTVKRGDETVKLHDFPMEVREYTDQQGQTYEGYGLFFGVEEATFASKLSHSWNQTVDFARLVRLSLKMLFTGEAGLKDVSGPVGIVSTITEVGQESETVGLALGNIAYLGGLIAVNLAVMNLLPLPALDGGRIFFLVLNALAMVLFRRQIPAKYENAVHFAGMVLLLGFMAVVTFSDVTKLFR